MIAHNPGGGGGVSSVSFSCKFPERGVGCNEGSFTVHGEGSRAPMNRAAVRSGADAGSGGSNQKKKKKKRTIDDMYM